MDLLSAFKRKPSSAEADAAEAGDAIQRARTRARQRLIGAAVLVVAGIIVFPLLFETQPRPVPVDLPIEIPRKDAVAPLQVPPPVPAAPATTPPAAAATTPPAVPAATAPAERVITEADAGRELAAASAPAASRPASAAPAARLAAASAPEGAAAPKANPAAESAESAEAARAQALLEDRQPPASEAAAPRYIVQVGAFADPGSVRDARSRVEKLGLKTYTHVAETKSGPRTRVRVGPFATRAEAERAAARLKSASLPAAILVI